MIKFYFIIVNICLFIYLLYLFVRYCPIVSVIYIWKLFTSVVIIERVAGSIT